MNNKLQEIFSIMNNNSVDNSFNRAQDILNNRLRNPESLKSMADDYAAEADCPNYQLCNELQISKENICTKGSDTRYMCSFGESRFIMLLGRLLSNREKEN